MPSAADIEKHFAACAETIMLTREQAARRFERTLIPGLIHGRTRNIRPQVRT